VKQHSHVAGYRAFDTLRHRESFLVTASEAEALEVWCLSAVEAALIFLHPFLNQDKKGCGEGGKAPKSSFGTFF